MIADNSTKYHIGRRLDGEFRSAAAAFRGVGFDRKQAARLAVTEASGMCLAMNHGEYKAICTKKRGATWNVFDVILVNSSEIERVSLLCKTMIELAEHVEIPAPDLIVIGYSKPAKVVQS